MTQFFSAFIISAAMISCTGMNDDNPGLTTAHDTAVDVNAGKEIPRAEPIKKDSTKLPSSPPLFENERHGGIHPISLHWISWDKKGTASIEPGEDGWYNISGSQLNENREYLNIEGRIRRLSPKELEFEGTVETRVKINNGGEPCIKKGSQRFFGKGNRTYYRLQNMENCEGGNLVDYVDIFPEPVVYKKWKACTPYRCISRTR